MLLEIAVLAKSLATMRAHESLLSVVNSANVSSEVMLETEQLVTRLTSVFVRFVWIVQTIDMIAQL